MARDTRAAAALSPALRMALLASTAFATELSATAAANAACNPNLPVNGSTATCTGTTTNQGPDPGIGYGDPALTNLHVTVAPGASVTGTFVGIAFLDGTAISSGALTGSRGIFASGTANVTNHAAGTITGGDFGISANIANVTNFGSIRGNLDAISSATNATVTNSGSITGTTGNGVNAANTAFVTNSGTITGGERGVYADTANVINSGSITGIFDGILALSTANVINTGTIAGTDFRGVFSYGSATVWNSGAISGTSGITAWSGDATVTNSGTITATTFTAIHASGITSLTNSGVITSGGVAVSGDSGLVATNSGSISGGTWGVTSLADLTLTNTGIITGGGAVGVASGSTATVNNSGTISGATSGVGSDAIATVINSGTITGQSRQGIFGGSVATVTNSGTITGGRNGVASNGTATVANSGTITGVLSGIWTYGTGVVTTSGFISGGNGTAIQFNANGTAASDTLNILPGARFGGRVDFGGGADRVNFGPGNWVLDTAQYDAALSTVTTPGTPYFITPNQIIVADTSSFRMMKRAMMDITGWISSVLPDSPVFETSATSGANAYAAIDASAPRFDNVFANFPSAAPHTPTPAFTGGTVNDAHGNAFWAKGFGGRRDQGAGDGVIAGITTGAGVAIGFDADITGNTRLGVFAGGSDNDTRFALNAGSIGIDTMFAGLYSRTLAGSSFLDLALIGGTLDNESKRNINGVTPQTASARYDGWFLTPLLTLGHRFALPYNLSLTPAVKIRYVAAHFDGYAESGSNVNLIVGAQNFRGVEERAEVTLAGVQHWNGSRITFRAHGGLLARQYAGDETVNVAFIGNNVLAAIGERDAYGLYAGGGFAWQTRNVALFTSAEVTGMNDNSTIIAGKGGVRVVW